MTKEVMTTEKARAMLAASEVIYSAEEVTAALDRMAGEIKAQLSEKYPLVLCVMTGGAVFCGNLLPRLDFPLDFDYLHATRYGRGESLARDVILVTTIATVPVVIVLALLLK